jgi:uncharacterized protein YraI
MKLNKLTAALLVAGLSTSASAQVVDPIFGAAPNMTVGQEAAWSIAESILSLVSADITANGCRGGGNFVISATNGPVGTVVGNGTYPTGTPFPLNLNATYAATQTLFGRQYTVAQGLPAIAYIPQTQIQNYLGNFTFGYQSSIMIANATFQMNEFGAWPVWDEHVIKDFWRDTCNVAGCVTPSGTKTTMVRDAGLEVITKLTYPKTKWRQASTHVPPDGGAGVFTVTKQLIQATNGTACSMTMSGFSLADLNNPYIQGSLTVAP